MPPVRVATINPSVATVLSVTDPHGVHTLTLAQIPDTSTAAAIETWVNGTWVPANIVDYQLVVKVLTLVPLKVSVWFGNPSAVYPVNAIL